MVAEEKAEVVMWEEVINKGGLFKEDVSNKHQTRLQYVISRVKWDNSALF